MNMVEELFYRKPRPKADITDKDLIYFLKSADKSTTELKKHLDKNERRLLLRIIDARHGILELKMRDSFVDGWKLGAKFVLDTFSIP